MRIEVVTLFPELIQQALKFGVLGRAVERGLLSVHCEDPRAHTADVHRTVDDRPYGGGPGMVLKPEPLSAAIETSLSIRDSMTRSSSPSYRPATSSMPGSVENSFASACVNGTPCADR